MLKLALDKIILESTIKTELVDLIGDDADVKKAAKKGKLSFLDYVYTKYPKQIESIIKKRKIDWDELASILVKLMKVK